MILYLIKVLLQKPHTEQHAGNQDTEQSRVLGAISPSTCEVALPL